MASLPYIGSKISLVSNAEIRYEGTLYTINTEESTIALQNVKSFGTEGRKKPEVPASNEIYHFIIFRGKDIKDLTVLQGASKGSAGVKSDPAIVTVNEAPPRKGGNMSKMQEWWSDWGTPKGKKGKGKGKDGKGKDFGKMFGKGKGKDGKGKGKDDSKGRSGAGGGPRSPVGMLIPDAKATPEVGTDFDLDVAAKAPEDSTSKEKYDVGYDKTKSFFDTISSDAHRKKENKDAEQFKVDREKQREVDKDTFGATALKRPFGRRAARGRGGRGGGRF